MKISRIAILSTLVLTILFLASILRAEDSNNLLRNPGFEEGTDGWQSYGGTLTYKNNPVHTGSRAAFLFATEAEACIYQTVHVLAGHTYIFSGWEYQNNIYEPIILLQISWYDDENGTGEEISQNDSIGILYYPNKYSFLTTGTCVAPTNALSATVKGIVRIAAPDQFASVYFDDMSFLEITPTPTPTPTPMPSPTPTPTPSPTCAPNLLLTNASFEEGTANWSTYGGSLSLVESPARSGAHAVALNSDTISAIWIHQRFQYWGRFSVHNRKMYSFLPLVSKRFDKPKLCLQY